MKCYSRRNNLIFLNVLESDAPPFEYHVHDVVQHRDTKWEGGVERDQISDSIPPKQ